MPAPSDDVILAKWSPSSSAAAAAVGIDAVVQKQQQEEQEVDMDVDTDATKAVEGNNGASPANKEVEEEGVHWRWRPVSVSVLPSHPEPLVPPHLSAWILRNLEDRMWACADIQRLIALGLEHLVVVPPPPLRRQERGAKQRELDDAVRRAPGLSLGASEVATTLMARSGGSGGGTAVKKETSSASAAAMESMETMETTGTDKRQGEEEGKTETATTTTILGKPGVIPAWARSPLAALHYVMQSISAKIALRLVLAEQVKAMEGGGGGHGWGGGALRAVRRPDGLGMELRVWPKVPMLTPMEIEPDTARTKTKPLKPSSLGWSVIITEGSGDGTLSAAATHALSDNPPLSPWTSTGSLSAESVVLAAAVGHSMRQLRGIQHRLTSLLSQNSSSYSGSVQMKKGMAWELALVSMSSISPRHHTHTQGSGQHELMPAIACRHNYNQHEPSSSTAVVLYVYLNVYDGRPMLSLGPALTEGAVVLKNFAVSVTHRHQTLLSRRVETALTESIDETSTSRALHWVGVVASCVRNVLEELQGVEVAVEVATATAPFGFVSIPSVPRFITESLNGNNNSNRGTNIHTREGAGAGAVMAVLRTDVGATGGTTKHKQQSVLLSSCGVPVAKQGNLVGLLITLRNGTQQLTLCWSTPRGIPTSIYTTISITNRVERESVESGVARNNKDIKKKRKRAAEDEDEEEGAIANTDWKEMKTWCVDRIKEHRIEAQLQALFDSEEGSGAIVTKRNGSILEHTVELQSTWLGSICTAADDNDVAVCTVTGDDTFDIEIRSSRVKKSGGRGQFTFVDGDSAGGALLQMLCNVRAHACATSLQAACVGSAEWRVQVEKNVVSVTHTADPTILLSIEWSIHRGGAATKGGVAKFVCGVRSGDCQEEAQTLSSLTTLLASLFLPGEGQQGNHCGDDGKDRSKERVFLSILSALGPCARAICNTLASLECQQECGLLPTAMQWPTPLQYSISIGAKKFTVHGECMAVIRQLGRAVQVSISFHFSERDGDDRGGGDRQLQLHNDDSIIRCRDLSSLSSNTLSSGPPWWLNTDTPTLQWSQKMTAHNKDGNRNGNEEGGLSSPSYPYPYYYDALVGDASQLEAVLRSMMKYVAGRL